MSKTEILQFTKKFAMNKIDYQEQIQKLKYEIEDKNKIIRNLETQNNQLKIQ